MRFELTDEQQEFSSVVGDFFGSQFPPDRLRAIWEERSPVETGLWRGLADLGALGIVVPDRFGGSGAGHLELVLLLEAAGYAAFPEPLLETAGIAAPLILAWGQEAGQQEWLPRIAAGEARISVCEDPRGYAVSGSTADAIIVLRREELHLVPRGVLSWQDVRTQDPTRRLARADMSALTGATLLTCDPRAVEQFWALGRAASAAALVGLTRRILDITLTYVLQREQFGRVIGSFQVIKHRLADLAVGLEAARVLAWYAAYALTMDQEDAALAAMTAKASANDVASFANRNGLQLHGGVGFTWEYDLHFWLMRGQAWEASFGRQHHLRQSIGRAVVGLTLERQLVGVSSSTKE